jgi:hypothetical protein
VNVTRIYERLNSSSLRIYEAPVSVKALLDPKRKEKVKAHAIDYKVVAYKVRVVKEMALTLSGEGYTMFPVASEDAQNTIKDHLKLWMGNEVVTTLKKKRVVSLMEFISSHRPVICPERVEEADECHSLRAIIIGVREAKNNRASLCAVEFERVEWLKRVGEMEVEL